MLYPKNIEDKIGFHIIREILKENCNGTVGQGYVDKMRFTDKPELIIKLVKQTEEMRFLLSSGVDFPKSNFIDTKPLLKKAAIQGTFLLAEELYDLRKSLYTLQRCIKALDMDDGDQFPELLKIRAQVEFDASILNEIDRVIDDKGHIKDNASAQLSKIRSKKISEETQARKRLAQVLQELKKQGIAKEAANPTIREGRMVVPIAAEYKRKVKGFVHDSSATGQTVFIEPEAILEINNNIRELEFAERQEVIKILTEVTKKIYPLVEPLGKANLFLGMLDFIKAKSEFCKEIDACLPEVVESPKIEWYQAYHPLLKFNYTKQGRVVVPQKIQLEEESRIMVISGPNAGGKSVTFKNSGAYSIYFSMWVAHSCSKAL